MYCENISDDRRVNEEHELDKKTRKFESVRKSIEHYLSTDWFMWVCFLIACFITVLRVEAIGLLIFAAIICAILVFCEDVIIALEPFSFALPLPYKVQQFL